MVLTTYEHLTFRLRVCFCPRSHAVHCISELIVLERLEPGRMHCETAEIVFTQLISTSNIWTLGEGYCVYMMLHAVLTESVLLRALPTNL